VSYTRRAALGALLGFAAATGLSLSRRPRPRVDREEPEPERYAAVYELRLHEHQGIGGVIACAPLEGLVTYVGVAPGGETRVLTAEEFENAVRAAQAKVREAYA